MALPDLPFTYTAPPNYTSGAPDGVSLDTNPTNDTGVAATVPVPIGGRYDVLLSKQVGPKVPTDIWGIPLPGAYKAPKLF